MSLEIEINNKNNSIDAEITHRQLELDADIGESELYVEKDYNDLVNKPSINNVTLEGNKTSDDLNLQSKITEENKLDYNLLENEPTKTSEFTNNGEDGSSPYATQKWVLDNEIEGKIDVITKNGEELPVIDKTVNIEVPTKNGELENDSNFATEEYVNKYGGKIDSIELNGETLPIENKNVNIEIDKTDVGLSNVDNTSDIDKPISTKQQEAITKVQLNIDSEVTNRIEADKNLQSNLTAHEQNTNNPHKVTKSQVGLSEVDNTSDKNKPVSTPTQSALDLKLDKENANLSITKDINVDVDGDNVYLDLNYRNLNTKTETSNKKQIKLASDSEAGLMSIADYAQIRKNTEDIGQLKDQNIRLLYTTSENPTSEDIKNFVISEGYTDESKWVSIAVVVQNTNHIWRYYDNTQIWQDIGVDTVNQFTNSIAGIIKGSATAGKVYAETDGTGSVYGWDNLNTSVSNNTTAISDETTNRTNADSTLQTNIDDEKTARESADTNLQSQITTNAENIATNTTNISSKMDKENPTGTGSFSLNRKTGTTIGTNSFAEGFKTTASGSYSHSEGNSTTASAPSSHSEGAETTASGLYAHSEGYNTIAQRQSQHVFGEYNIADTQGNTSSRGEYVEIVGNGTAASRSNARTLDWSGNETLAGNLQASGLTDGTTTKTMTEMVGLVDKVATNTTNIANKLEASNIKAGTNITVSTSGNDVTISAETGEGGTNVYVNNVKQDSINFTSDPQTQIDNTVKTSGDQSIAGTKDFTGKIKGSSAYFPNGFGALGTETIPSFTFSDAVNVGMELGRRDGTAGTPYIDFHTDGSSSTDFNSRMLASGNALNITATGGLLVNGTNVGVTSYSSSETGYIRYDNGLQICWGRVSGNNKTFYYPVAFKSNSSYSCSGVSASWTGSYGNYGMSNLTATSFYLNADKSATWLYLAIGFWK